MGQLIDALLLLARVSRAEPRCDPVNLQELAEQVIESLRAAEPERSVEFVCSGALACEGDAALLRVLLENLLGNAWKFTSQRPAARIELSGQGTGPERVYCVRDNGAGFDMVYAGKLFGAFQRLHTQQEFPGSGVGLATVLRIVGRHGGRIWAEGRVGHGASFRFTLARPA
jgi:light-regulated signal transduction histidine kinase (bacteriophytochrome)